MSKLAYLTQKQMAERLGVTEQTIIRYRRRGLITPAAVFPGRVLYDPEQVKAELAEKVYGVKSGEGK